MRPATTVTQTAINSTVSTMTAAKRGAAKLSFGCWETPPEQGPPVKLNLSRHHAASKSQNNPYKMALFMIAKVLPTPSTTALLDLGDSPRENDAIDGQCTIERRPLTLETIASVYPRLYSEKRLTEWQALFDNQALASE